MKNQRKNILNATLMLMALLLGGRGFAQTATPKAAMKKYPAASAQEHDRLRQARRTLILSELETLAAQVEQSGEAQLRCQVLLHSADLLWDTDPAQARQRFEQAWLTTAAIALPSSSGQTETTAEWNHQRQQTRQAILNAVLKREPQLARQFAESLLSESRAAAVAEKSAAQTLWLDVTTQLAAAEPGPDGLTAMPPPSPAQPALDDRRITETFGHLLHAQPSATATTGISGMLTTAELTNLRQTLQPWQPLADLTATLAQHRELADPLQRTLAFVMLAQTLREQQADERAEAVLAELEAWLSAAKDKESQRQAWLALAEEYLARDLAHAEELFQQALRDSSPSANSTAVLAAFTATLHKFAEADFERAWALAGKAETLSMEVALKLALCQTILTGGGASPH